MHFCWVSALPLAISELSGFSVYFLSLVVFHHFVSFCFFKSDMLLFYHDEYKNRQTWQWYTPNFTEQSHKCSCCLGKTHINYWAVLSTNNQDNQLEPQIFCRLLFHKDNNFIFRVWQDQVIWIKFLGYSYNKPNRIKTLMNINLYTSQKRLTFFQIFPTKSKWKSVQLNLPSKQKQKVTEFY
jgi:hypothetical protein